MAHPDAYGPVTYEAYIPFEQAFSWNESSEEQDLSAPRAAAIVFDLLAVALLFLIGRRVRGPALGIALAYAWVSYPFTLYALEANSNDALVAVLVLAALLAATYRSKVAVSARGAFAALAGLAKFAPLALAPLLATHGAGDTGPAGALQRSGGTRRGHGRDTGSIESAPGRSLRPRPMRLPLGKLPTVLGPPGPPGATPPDVCASRGLLRAGGHPYPSSPTALRASP